jgi:hypothetical protein
MVQRMCGQCQGPTRSAGHLLEEGRFGSTPFSLEPVSLRDSEALRDPVVGDSLALHRDGNLFSNGCIGLSCSP